MGVVDFMRYSCLWLWFEWLVYFDLFLNHTPFFFIFYFLFYFFSLFFVYVRCGYAGESVVGKPCQVIRSLHNILAYTILPPGIS